MRALVLPVLLVASPTLLRERPYARDAHRVLIAVAPQLLVLPHVCHVLLVVISMLLYLRHRVLYALQEHSVLMLEQSAQEVANHAQPAFTAVGESSRAVLEVLLVLLLQQVLRRAIPLALLVPTCLVVVHHAPLVLRVATVRAVRLL